jgi:hypothetical protein
MPNEYDPTNATPAAPTATDGVEDAPAEKPAPRYMTLEEWNRANTAMSKRLETRLMKLFDEKLAAARGEQPKPADPDQAAALSALQAIESERAQQLTAATEREQQLLAREMRTTVEHELTRLGCINPRAARLILSEDNRVGRNDAGELIFYNDEGEPVDLADGVKQWLFGSDEGKRHAPVRGGGEGSGTIVRNNGRPGPAAPSKNEQRREAMGVISKWVLGNR